MPIGALMARNHRAEEALMSTVVGGGGGMGDGFGGEENESEVNLCRSGSAPPTVEGSLAALGGVFVGDGAGLSESRNMDNGFPTEEELRSDPSYLSYYYSNVKMNPRLPPPLLSREDWRFTSRLQAGSSIGRIGDRQKARRADDDGSVPPFLAQREFNPRKEREVEPWKSPDSGDWLDNGNDGLIGLSSAVGLGGKQKSIADIFQDDLGCSAPVSRHPSRPASRNAFDDGAEMGPGEAQVANLHHELASVNSLHGNGTMQGVAAPSGSVFSRSFASVVDSSLLRSHTPDPEMVARAPSPCLPPIGVRVCSVDKRTNNSSNSLDISSGITEPGDIATALSGMNLSRSGISDNGKHEIEDQPKFLFGLQGGENHASEYCFLKKPDAGQFSRSSAPQLIKSSYNDLGSNGGVAYMIPEHPGDNYVPTAGSGSFLKASVINQGDSSQSSECANEAFTSYGLNGYPLDAELSSMPNGTLHHLFENVACAPAVGSPGVDYRAMGAGFSSGSNLAGIDHLRNLNKIGKNYAATAALQGHLMDPLYLQYLKAAEYTAQGDSNFIDPAAGINFVDNSYLDVNGLQKAYLGTLLSSQKQHGMPFLGKTGSLNHGYYDNRAFNLGHAGNPLGYPVLSNSLVGSGSPLRHGDLNLRFSSGMRNFGGDVIGSPYSYAAGTFDDGFASSLLEEFKTNKTRCFELSEIASHVVEFSADQYGSRFIQQKLETATTEEKNMVFEEIMPEALSLMTDVFGNYVIQKFFELGSPPQRRELADQLTGHVLTLSLQMYGCRVIQKALEVVDLDQQIKMVAELEGHVMRCVRDQNGNHVIQKCIERIPQDSILFIVSSFFDQVVTLSTHPYGCRVIQRVLEHCDDPKTQQTMMDEILQSVCLLAQDQYGNYVVQHVLERGKPHERSAVIKKLSGQIVQMSQQKFASNVVEKCLTFGSPAERQILVNEMLGSTDENEPLQAMMKDQYANYVVQKVLETCSDQQRELILSRIKVHLTALKKYTYGKHIVARVEKLVATGERRSGVQLS